MAASEVAGEDRGVAAVGSRRVRWIVTAIVLVVGLYLVPLFRLVPLEATRAAGSANVFDAVAYVEAFWTGPLQARAGEAVEAGELLAALRNDAVATAARHGHRLGLSGSVSYLVSGRGTVVARDDYAVSLALRDHAAAEVVIEIGPVFGNAIRDGSGLLDVSDFSNTRDFNALSGEINRRVEERVLPELQAKAAVGVTVEFVGAAEVGDADRAPAVLRVVPFSLVFP